MPERGLLLAAIFSVAACSPATEPASEPAASAEPATVTHAMAPGPIPGQCEAPASEHPDEVGCYLTANLDLPAQSGDLYWYVSRYADRAAADAARSGHAIISESYGRTWLHAFAPDGAGFANAAETVKIGPLKQPEGVPLRARLIESRLEEGMATRAHVHSGPEAFFLLDGAQCLETRDGGAQITNAGEWVLAPTDQPMRLYHSGVGPRRGLALILHDAAKPWMTMSDWAPPGQCPS